jgi:hypothetical protein
VHLRALIGLGRTAEASLAADRIVGTLQAVGGVGVLEVGTRLAVAEAFSADGQPERARVELAETLRQVKLRADDITDPFWRESYLTRNPHVVRALALGEAGGLPSALDPGSAPA